MNVKLISEEKPVQRTADKRLENRLTSLIKKLIKEEISKSKVNESTYEQAKYITDINAKDKDLWPDTVMIKYWPGKGVTQVVAALKKYLMKGVPFPNDKMTVRGNLNDSFKVVMKGMDADVKVTKKHYGYEVERVG